MSKNQDAVVFQDLTPIICDYLCDYLCEEKGISPRKEYSGKFNLRIPPELHSKIAAKATAEHKSINQWVAEALEESLHQ